MSVKNFLLGKALRNDQLGHEKLTRMWGLPIMASDAVSSVAYAVEEISMALVPMMGLSAGLLMGAVGLPIIILLLLLVFSYTQIINHYPHGGGAYIVSKENFGRRPSLLAATCLIVDYIMTVAVSISSSTAAIMAAFPSLQEFSGSAVLISLISLALITVINLRGVTESSKIFGIPAYAFIISMVLLITVGFGRLIFGSLTPIPYDVATQVAPQMANPDAPLEAITFLLFLKAFSSGCAALTGVEAVSDAVPNFKSPSQKTAKQVLFMLAAIIVFIFGGTTWLATSLHAIHLNNTTVMSQLASAVFGNGILYYAVQFTTSLILLLAANTAYNGLPIMLSILAKDRYMPRQFSQRGTKLSFSNGIMFIAIVAGVLLIAFDAQTHSLIPFYAVGVFVSFTLSQAGIFVKWLKTHEKGWRYKSLINLFGAIVTLVGTVVVFSNKFMQGAWVLLLVVPLIMFFMSVTHRHYFAFDKEISLEGYDYHYEPSQSRDILPVVVLIHNMNKASLKTFDYAQDLSSDVTALHISTTKAHTEQLKQQWKDLGIGVPLTVIDAPFRDVMLPLEKYITEREARLKKGDNLTVVLTKFVGTKWRDRIFHNQTTFFIESRLGRHKNIATVLVPYLYKTRGYKEGPKDEISEDAEM